MSYHTIPYHTISYHIISYIISYRYTWYISQRWAQTFLKYPLYPSIVIECIRTTLNCSSLPVMQPCWLFWPNSNNRNIKENSIKHSPFLVSRGRDFRTDAWRILTVQPHLVMKYKAVQQKKQWMMFSCLENLGWTPTTLLRSCAPRDHQPEWHRCTFPSDP